MAVSSMTGFARGGGALDALSWNWEVKSVNGRGLDVRCRLPTGMDAVEQAVRQRIGERLQRGHVAVALQLSGGAEGVQIKVNHAVLEQLASVAGDLSERLGLAGASVDGLLALRGIVEVDEPEIGPEERQRREKAILASLGPVLDALEAGRREEGQRLHDLALGQLGQNWRC